MSGVQPPANPDPLRETTRYTKVADLSHGSFGFVQLARNTETQELVAIKFIERGDRVNRWAAVLAVLHRYVPISLLQQRWSRNMSSLGSNAHDPSPGPAESSKGQTGSCSTA